MTTRNPIPELLHRRPTRARWRQRPPTHLPHQPTADPLHHIINTPTDDEPTSHASRLAALIATRYNTRRPDKSPLLAGTRDLFHAAQELRNRHLAHRANPDLPRPRYYLPKQLAAHHITRNKYDTAHALELAGLLHHPADLNTYLDTLTHQYQHPELAQTIRNLSEQTNHLLAALDDELRTNPHRRHHHHAGTYGLNNLRLTPAELTAHRIRNLLENTADQCRDAARTDQTNQHRRRQTEHHAHKHNTKPPAGDLTGWYPVIPNKPPREVTHTGRLGRRRIATNAGKNPNRIHNYAGDPLRRIFTRNTRGTNALVIIDVSGSMDLTTAQVAAIMNASAGATVVAYSASDDTTPNFHLLAHKGRRTRTLPRFAGGNGIDAPAADYAVKNYHKTGAPIIWITDGQATGRRDATNDELRAQCRRVATTHKIIVSPNVKTALTDLADLKRGKRPPQRLHTFHE